MSDSLNLLISLLNYINTDETIDIIDGHYSYTNPLVNAVLFIANDYLIGEDGHPDRKSIDTIIRAGFPIFPGEQDRFGWLTGCIELRRGIIMFG
jgi:hypothetical protein